MSGPQITNLQHGLRDTAHRVWDLESELRKVHEVVAYLTIAVVVEGICIGALSLPFLLGWLR